LWHSGIFRFSGISLILAEKATDNCYSSAATFEQNPGSRKPVEKEADLQNISNGLLNK
jgi:hypothetical protein